jgi:hypothetical protein
VQHARNTPRRLFLNAASNLQRGPSAPRGAMTSTTSLTLNGQDVGVILDVSDGPEIGAALRWLQAEVALNPELNTRAALTALLRYAAPLRAFGHIASGDLPHPQRAQRAATGRAALNVRSRAHDSRADRLR